MLSSSQDSENVSTLRGYVPTFQTGKGYLASPLYYLCISQEAAACHAKLNRVDIPTIMPNNRSWVVLYTNIDIYKSLSWQDEWVSKTYIIPERNPMLSRRIVECYDSKGDAVFTSDSLWSVIKIENGKKMLSDSTEFVDAIGLYKGDVSKFRSFDRLRHFAIDSPTFTFKKTSNITDRDINDHVNNISYVRWALEAIPSDQVDDTKIKKMKINFSDEMKIGDSVNIDILKESLGVSYKFLINISKKAYLEIIQDK